MDGYLGLGVGRSQRPITDELIATKLEELRQTHATLEAVEVDRPVAAGDYVVVDMAASKGAKPLKDGAISNFDIHVGQGLFHPEVEKALEGMKADQEKTVTVRTVGRRTAKGYAIEGVIRPKPGHEKAFGPGKRLHLDFLIDDTDSTKLDRRRKTIMSLHSVHANSSQDASQWGAYELRRR